MQTRNYNKSMKYIRNDSKRLKYWDKMSDEDKIKFIMEYTTNENEIMHSWKRNYIHVYDELKTYDEKFFNSLMKDLWKNSNYNVQSNTYENYQNIVNDIVININDYIADRNWEFTNPKLQQEIMLKIINMQLNDSNMNWKYGSYYTDDRKNECKCEEIIGKLNGMNETSLLEIYDKIENFISEYADKEQKKEFIERLPEEVRNEKIYNSIEYSLRDVKLFSKKWETLTYEEKLLEFKNIFFKYTKEYMSGSEAINDRDKSIIETAYPKFFSVQDDKNPFSKNSYINFSVEIIKKAVNGIGYEDLDKLVYRIIEEKKNSPITLYFVWEALDRKSQIKYYDKVMEILADKPESRFEIWHSSKVDSNNKDKKIQSTLFQIKTEEDIKKI